MSSHPGATMQDAVEMALWLKKWGYSPEQVQDFYPTPGTISTVMYYTGIHPMTGKSVYVTTDYHEKQLQRALLQYKKPENANLVREALRLANREDLIGTGPECLVRPAFGKDGRNAAYTKPVQKGSGHRAASAHPQKKTARNTPAFATGTDARKKQSKLARVFGEDAARILKEADRLGKSSGEKRTSRAQKGARPMQKKRGSR
jgi:hypothetical protein